MMWKSEKQATLLHDIACSHVWEVACHIRCHFATIQRVNAQKWAFNPNINVAASRPLYTSDLRAC